MYFLSVVDVPSIPFHLVAGPSLDVCVHDDTALQWIVDSLFLERDDNVDSDQDKALLGFQTGGQLNRGILLKVGDGAGNIRNAKAAPSITELLLYATVSATSFAKSSLPTPPVSSSPGPGDSTSIDEAADSTASWKIYALPLSSDLISQAAEISSLSANHPGEAQFLLPLSGDDFADQDSHCKHKKVSSLFEDAAQRSKRLKRRGGERISKAMSNLEPSPILSQSIEYPKPTELPNDSYNSRQGAKTGLSRASSAMSTRSIDSSRPLSRRESLLHGKRSLLQRVESMSSPLGSPQLTHFDSSIEQQNKSALTRIVMAGMRVHGLQQKRTLNRAHTISGIFNERSEAQKSVVVPEDDGMYKTVYHQTFKAASFTFRTHVASTIIPQEALRDVVDRLLAIFCTDPLQANDHRGIPTSETEPSSAKPNPFDLPSASAHMAGILMDRRSPAIAQQPAECPT